MDAVCYTHERNVFFIMQTHFINLNIYIHENMTIVGCKISYGAFMSSAFLSRTSNR